MLGMEIKEERFRPISPFSTEKEISFTATKSPNDFVRDFVSIEYINPISSGNYKLLSIRSEKIIQNLKRVFCKHD